MIDYEDALEIVLKGITPLGIEPVGIFDAVGRVLAEEIKAEQDVPDVDLSARDGYAVRAKDVADVQPDRHVALEVVDEIPAGKIPGRRIGCGETARIFTGAIIPEGADAVVMQENTGREGGRVVVLKGVQPGDNVRRAGADMRSGRVAMRPGIRIGAAEIGAAAALNREKINVYMKPAAGVISTGTELVEPGGPSPPGGMRNSSNFELCAAIGKAGAVPQYLGIVNDNPDALKKSFIAAASICDMVITTGGVSVGDYDYVPDILVEIGEVFFKRVGVYPGKSMTFATVKGTPFLCFPGNPVSALVSFELFARTAIMKMTGAENFFRPGMISRLEHDIRGEVGHRQYVRGVLTFGKSGLSVRMAAPLGSGVISSMLETNSLIVIPAETGRMSSGEMVEVIYIGEM